MKIWPVIERALDAHGTCVMISVVRAEGSTPREQGARIIVTPQGFHGTIGGGCGEAEVWQEAMDVIAAAWDTGDIR